MLKTRGDAVLAAVFLALALGVIYSSAFGDLPVQAAITLTVFLIAVFLWIATSLDDTYVALGAALALVVTGVLTQEDFTHTLGTNLIWLLIGAFVVAAAINATGLMTKFAAYAVVRAHTPRQLVHLLTAALLISTFAIPAPSGRAALTLPVFMSLGAMLAERRRLVIALAMIFPTVILFSAIGSMLGAGAHLVTNEILAESVNDSFSFDEWLLLGLPLAVLWSHLAAEAILLMFTDAEDRRRPISVPANSWPTEGPESPGTPLTRPQRQVLFLLAAVVIGWSTQPIHHVHPAIIALIGALIAVAPRIGATTLPKALKTVPWSLLIFMAATLALATAITKSGAADWIHAAFSSFRHLGAWASVAFVIVTIVGSVAAHLVIQSRSARSAVLIPIIVATAPVVGVNPAAAAFISTAAAGFCVTMTSSAKPIAMFAGVEGVATFNSRDLLRLSGTLAPVSVALLALFAFAVWPALGLKFQLQ